MNLSSSDLRSPSGATARYLTHEPSVAKLAVFLPGANYSCDRPALHYLRQMALHQGYDCLSLQYGFQAAGTAHDVPAALEEARQTMASVAGRGYREFLFVGKSMGTAIARTLAAEAAPGQVSVILLTPAAPALGPVGAETAGAGPGQAGGMPVLAVLGTKDPVYGTGAYEAARQRGDMEWLVLDGVPHGLDHPAGWAESVAVLQRILGAAEAFLDAARA